MTKEVRIPVTLLRRAGAEYVDRVYYKKERIIITNRGKDVAVLVPTDDPAVTKSTKANKANETAIKLKIRPRVSMHGGSVKSANPIITN